MKSNFLIKLFSAVAAVASMSLNLPAQAASIAPTTALNNWLKVPEPLGNQNINAWTVSGANSQFLDYTENRGQALVSNFIQQGNFSFSSQIRNLTTGDDDRYGLVFGFQNSLNHYRFSWESRSVNGGIAEQDGSRGLSLIRETNGVATSLFNLPSTYWTQNRDYSVTVGRIGNTISLNVSQVGGGNIASFSTIDTTYMTGRVGLWSHSQVTRYSNLDYTAVPEPSVVLGTVLVLGCGVVSRKRCKQA